MVTTAQVCSEESASTTYSRTVDKVATWAKVAQLYGKSYHSYATSGKTCSTNRGYPTLPYATLPCHNLPYPALHYTTLPYPSLPYPTLLYPTLPCLALPYLTSPYLTLPYLILPYPTLPYSTLPHLIISYYTDTPSHLMMMRDDGIEF